MSTSDVQVYCAPPEELLAVAMLSDYGDAYGEAAASPPPAAGVGWVAGVVGSDKSDIEDGAPKEAPRRKRLACRVC